MTTSLDIEFYPVDILSSRFGWKDKRTALKFLKELGVKTIPRAGKYFFSIAEYNQAFREESTEGIYHKLDKSNLPDGLKSLLK